MINFQFSHFSNAPISAPQAPKSNRTQFWRLKIENWLFAGYLILVIGILLLPASLSAEQTPGLRLFLSALATRNGYTIVSPDNQLTIQIAAKSLNRAVVAELAKQDEYPTAPLDKDLISAVYQYSFLPATNNELASPITIAISYPKQETRWREIFFYNFESKEWQHLPGGIELKDNYLVTQTAQASGLIAVFADHLDQSEYLKEQITAPSIYVADAQTGEVLIERAGNVRRPIASLTKLATASVFIENNPGWNARIAMVAEDDTIPAKIYTKLGDTLTTQDLFYATLMRSANNAAKALARSTGLSTDTFVQAMNDAARTYGMEQTSFVEPTGLSENDISTAQDVFRLARHAFADPAFLQATTPKARTITIINRKLPYSLQNTNRILDVPYVVLGSKTGYTDEAGRCLVMKAKNDAGREVIAVILGGKVPNGHWSDMRLLLDAALGE